MYLLKNTEKYTLIYINVTQEQLQLLRQQQAIELVMIIYVCFRFQWTLCTILNIINYETVSKGRIYFFVEMGDEKKDNIDLKLSASLSRFGIRGRGSSLKPSLKQSRDGSGAVKRTYTPNIVSRGTKKEESRDERDPRFKQGNRSTRNRNKGRGRGRGEIISTTGIFSQGPAVQRTLASVFSGGYRSGGGGGYGQGGKPKQEGDATTSRAAIHATRGDQEDELVSDKVFDLLKDEGKIEVDEDEMKLGNLAPITLPLASRLTQKIKDELKNENLDVAMGDEMTVTNNMENKLKDEKKLISELDDKKRISDIFLSPQTDENSNGQLLFFQLPDALPIKSMGRDDPSVKMEPGVSQGKEILNDEDIEEKLQDFSFQNVSEGHIGKLQIHKSGKVKMRLGNVLLDVSLGTPCGFLQDLISVHPNKTPAEMVLLGHINNRLIAIPDYISMLGELT